MEIHPRTNRNESQDSREIWRNKYEKNDWQDIHIHPSPWSFIIYETVETSKTVFMNSYKLIQNQIGTGHLVSFRF